MSTTEAMGLKCCFVFMLAQVELRVGDDLEFHPKETPEIGVKEPVTEWEKFCKPRLGKLARIIDMEYKREPMNGLIPFDPAAMYANPEGLVLKVRFQDERELHDIPLVHFVNHAPRHSSL